MGSEASGVGTSGAIYGLGVVGAVCWFWSQATSFWDLVWAIFQGLTWPAWMVYQAFEALAR